MKHLNISIQGRVQGVFFRASTRDVADSLNLKGFVENCADGSVYIEAEGEPERLAEFLEWCHKGPVRSVVTAVDHKEGEWKGFRDFTIKR